MSRPSDLTRLTFALHSNPGRYALLLGSGVSRSAQILTGAEILDDLMRGVAAIEQQDPGDDLAAWYLGRYAQAPNYSDLIAHLAPLRAERSALLRRYFEPANDEDTSHRPTPAHHAIAQLMAAGVVRVVLTTNFDRLLEGALGAIGRQATVISTGGDIEGMEPLAHAECLIVKLHGDYLDLRLRNTVEELEEYEPAMDSLLKQVIDTFGLIVCGWSADWDRALREAISRSPSRRYTTYWAARRAPTGAAGRLVTNRQAVVVSIRGADEFFSELSEGIDALSELARDPDSIAMAVVRLKRALADDSGTITARDLLATETERVWSEIKSAGSSRIDDIEALEAAYADYEALCEPLMYLSAVAGYWARPSLHQALTEMIERLANHPATRGGGDSRWHTMNLYPAELALYSAGIAALAAGRFDNLAAVAFRPQLRNETANDIPANVLLAPTRLVLAVTRSAINPISSRLHLAVRSALRDAIPDDARFDDVFDLFEAIFSLGKSWVGRYYWSRQWDDGAEFKERVLAVAPDLADAGIVGSESEVAPGVDRMKFAQR